MSTDLDTKRAFALISELANDRAFDPTARLRDIGFDSLGFTELAAALEESSGLDLAGADLSDLSTVDDVLRAVEFARRGVPATGVPAGIGRSQPFAKAAGGWAFRRWFRLEVIGAEHVPRRGPVVVAMNHESALDVPLAVVACPRPITFMSKKELYKNALASRALHELGGFPVDRGRFDLRSVRIAMAALRRGDVLGMYPEGTRAPGRLLPFLPGAAWLATVAGAPLVACSISGTDRTSDAKAPGRVHVRLEFGPAIEVPVTDDARERRRTVAKLTEDLRSQIETRLGYGNVRRS
jgi:1-acyl-sn-glycerol-3-phosphate acyltransferase